jgi:hypothetical protein
LLLYLSVHSNFGKEMQIFFLFENFFLFYHAFFFFAISFLKF